MRAKAAVLYEVGTPLRLEEVEVLPPQRGEVQVRMYAGGVCHSDLHVMKGDLEMPLPIILGHEGSGIVECVGDGVTSVQPGDHVIPIWRVSCGTCEYCTGGRPALCDVGTQVRVTGLMPDGTTRFRVNMTPIRHFAGVSTFAQLSTMPEAAVLKIPPDFPLDKAALLGCGVITGVGAVVNAANVRMGSSVAVFGCGGIGLNAVQGARIVGALTIIAVDVAPQKLAYAQQMGATHLVNAAQDDPVAAIKELTGGRGVEYAFEAIGLPKTIEQAYAATRKRGTCVVIGVTRTDTPVQINANELVYAEKTLIGSLYGSSRPKVDILNLIQMYQAGKLRVDELLTRTYPLEEINTAYAALEKGEVARSLVLA
jgi:S-(hydroxymethyl)glutathione dehydrogenase / alcohol dehydrogenase